MELNINGSRHEIDVEPDTPLLWALREGLGLTGTKCCKFSKMLHQLLQER